MAQLSVEEIRRLARNFLVGKGGQSDLEDLKREMESDPQLPFELLQLMQTALDEVPPAGFSPDQWKEMDARIASMVNPLLRTGFGNIGRLFSGLFKKNPKESIPAPARLKRRGYAQAEAEPEVQASPQPSAPTPVFDVMGQAHESMEEMAPIAPAAPVPDQPSMPELAQTPEPESKAFAEEPEPVAVAEVRGSRNSRKGWLLAVVVVVAALAAYAIARHYLSREAQVPVQVAKAQATPALTPSPVATAPVQQATHPGLPTRSRGVADLSEPLPSDIPPQTPQPADNQSKPMDLEARDAQGNHGFPLP